MRYATCKNKKCSVYGWPYTFDDEVDKVPDCAECGKPMREVDEPTQEVTVETQEPTANEEVEAQRQVLSAHISATLSWTDMWVVRAIEDGTTLSDERREYRQQLRALLAEVATCDHPDKVKVPEPPQTDKH